MTAGQILDALTENLLRHDGFLSVAERQLIARLIHHSKAHSEEQTTALAKTIALAVGDTVERRAYEVVGSGILDRLEASIPGDYSGKSRLDFDPGILGSGPMPQPPHSPSPGGPRPPGPREPQPPSQPRPSPMPMTYYSNPGRSEHRGVGPMPAPVQSPSLSSGPMPAPVQSPSLLPGPMPKEPGAIERRS